MPGRASGGDPRGVQAVVVEGLVGRLVVTHAETENHQAAHYRRANTNSPSEECETVGFYCCLLTYDHKFINPCETLIVITL